MISRVVSGVLLLVMITTVAWQVGTGNVLGGNWRVWFRRAERPVAFWLLIAFQIFVTMWMAVIAASAPESPRPCRAAMGGSTRMRALVLTDGE
jgi:hypothetical protein